MPDRIDVRLFMAGLICYFCGQVLLNVQGQVTRADAPVDLAHWLLLVGAVLLLPFAAKLPRRGVGLAAAVLLIGGVAAVIDMCVIDFVFWSVEDPALRSELVSGLMSTPAVWLPFMVWGPNPVFGLGLALPSLLYLRRARVGTLLVWLGAGIVAAGPAWFNVAGYAVLTAGYAWCFRQDRGAAQEAG